ncbi:MAG: alpha/beta hydrolase [Lachnospiraceae bacterium]|nr:alpha/beta hydrolase [Lachnospiraceae bacterium]
MKTEKLMIYILLSLVLFLVLIMSFSVYMRLKPPESVVLVAFRMPYQMLSHYLTITCGVGVILYMAFILIKHCKPERYALFLGSGFAVCCMMGVIYSMRIWGATAKVSGMKYQKTMKENVQYEVQIEDLHEQRKVSQCSLFTPTGSPYEKNLVVYLNYGGWSAQDEKMGTYLQELVTDAGYSYVRFVGTEKEQGNITDIVKSVKGNLNLLVEERQYEKVVLIGGSAGGNIALITTFSNDDQDIFGEAFPVDGVIALYPMTDMESAYEYFVEQAEATSFLGKLGDKLYCGLYGNDSGTRTFAGETKKLDEAVFGEKQSEDSLYKKASVLNLVGEQNIPTLMIGGNADSMVVVEDNRKMYEYMKSKGMDCAYLELPNVEHAFDIVDNTARRRTCVEIEKWLDTVFSK